VNVIFDDLRTRDCSLTPEGRVLVYDNKNHNKVIATRQLIVGARGEIGTRELEPVPIDQTGEIKKVLVSQRWNNTDQQQL
jgi:hypothetical protein